MRLLAACLLLAGLSLFLPSVPSFDPWAWIVWGREVASFELNTVGGPSWKPLPVFFTAIFAPLGAIDESVPPALWIVVARAGALLALAMAFLLARRLAGPSRWAGLAAGTLAALALAFTPQWLRNAAHGNEVPLAVGLLLWGVHLHLEGRRLAAIVLGFLACLLRPEVFPFLAAYAVWLWRAEPERRVLVAGLAVALPVVWLVPEWIGSGDPLSAGNQARSEPSWSLSLTARPWLAALERAHNLAGLPIELGALAAAACAWRRREGVDRVTLALAGVALAWLGLVVIMVEAGFSGSPRYFIPAVVLGCVLAGVGAARLVEAMPGTGAATAVALVLAAVLAPWAVDRVRYLERQANGVTALRDQHKQLVTLVNRLGGVDAVLQPGNPRISPAFMTRLAWEADLHFEDLEASPGKGFVFIHAARSRGRPAPSTVQLRRAPRVIGAWHLRQPLATASGERRSIRARDETRVRPSAPTRR